MTNHVFILVFCTMLSASFLSFILVGCDSTKELEANLQRFNEEFEEMTWKQQSVRWSYSSNMTESNAEVMNTFEKTYSLWMSGWKNWARTVDTSSISSPTQKRMIFLMSTGVACQTPQDARLVSELRAYLASIYASGKVRLEPDQNHNASILVGEDAVNGFMASNLGRPTLLRRVWSKWQQIVGKRSLPPFLRLAETLQICARQNGYENYGEAWISELEIPQQIETAQGLWHQVQDLYKQLHTYVRRKLVQLYGPEVVGRSSSIPVHLLGSLWGYNWQSLADLAMPYPLLPPRKFKTSSDQMKLVRQVEDSFMSMGLPGMTETFWLKSQFQKPQDDRVADCHSAAFDFAVGDDYRLRLCSGNTEISTIFHEMGHVLYFMAYRGQPVIFRNGANSAFHEAVGDAIADGQMAPNCDHKEGSASDEEELNFLMMQALNKVAILPWALLVDLWRYDVFSGTVPHLNEHWWSLREFYQGVRPPVDPRPGDFDPGTKYHIVNFMPYMRYFFSHLLEFQFLEALCNKDQPLHRCCLGDNEEAGSKLWDMLSLGSSRPWSEALRILTNSSRISADPLLRYFEPLHRWLKEQNSRTTDHLP